MHAFINYFSGLKIKYFAPFFKKIIYNTVQLFVSGFSAPFPSSPSPVSSLLDKEEHVIPFFKHLKHDVTVVSKLPPAL